MVTEELKRAKYLLPRAAVSVVEGRRPQGKNGGAKQCSGPAYARPIVMRMGFFIGRPLRPVYSTSGWLGVRFILAPQKSPLSQSFGSLQGPDWFAFPSPDGTSRRCSGRKAVGQV